MPVVEILSGAGPVLLEKRLSSRERAEPEAIARLRTEATLLAAVRETLGGRVVPRLVDAGEDLRGPFLRLERLPYPTLASHLDRAGGPLGEAFVARAFPALLAALAELHEAADAEGPLAIVHGDPSPANLVVHDDGGRAALLDLDLALWRGTAPRDGAFRGTLPYAAPEVARGGVPDVRADLFGVAAALLHAVRGQPPRRGPSYPALLALAAETPILAEPEAAALGARGPALASLVACLAFAPEARPASAREALARAATTSSSRSST